MKVSDLKKSDIDQCSLLLKILEASSFEIKSTEVGKVNACMNWVRELAHAFAEGWNEVHAPKAEEKPSAKGPTNVKIKNPSPSA